MTPVPLPSPPEAPDDGESSSLRRHTVEFLRHVHRRWYLYLPVAAIWGLDRKSTRLNSSHIQKSRMPSSA